MVSNDLKERVRKASDIVELVGAEINLRRTGRHYNGLCPWHDDTKPSLQINPERQTYRCWVCDVGGDVFSWVMRKEGVEFKEALFMLADRAGIPIQDDYDPALTQKKKSREGILEALDETQRVYKQQLQRNPDALRYLRERGLTDESIARFGLGYAPDQWQFLQTTTVQRFGNEILEQAGILGKSPSSGRVYDRFRGRIIIPIINEKGRTIAFAGRIFPEIGDHFAKYINSPETLVYRKSDVFFGYDEKTDEAIKREKEIFIVEGYVDIMLAKQHGFDNILSPCGTALPVESTKKLKLKYPGYPIVLVFDGDKGGRQGAFNVSKNLIARANSRICFLPEGKDPADLIRETGDLTALSQSLAQEKRKSLFDYYVACQLGKYDLKDKTRLDLTVPEDCQTFLERVSPDLAQMPEHALGIYLSRLERKLRMPKDVIESVILGTGYLYQRMRNLKRRNHFETMFIVRLLQMPVELKVLKNCLDPEMLKMPEARAVYEYLLKNYTPERYELLGDALGDKYRREMLDDLQKERPSLRRKTLLTMLGTVRGPRIRNRQELFQPLAEVIACETANLVRRAGRHKTATQLLKLYKRFRDNLE
ncbi:MAG: DNA primase [Candidatus Nanoarchaeia archaeon]|nr:DNA primase [Candidatus Nanoarchaeia archaeon]